MQSGHPTLCLGCICRIKGVANLLSRPDSAPIRRFDADRVLTPSVLRIIIAPLCCTFSQSFRLTKGKLPPAL